MAPSAGAITEISATEVKSPSNPPSRVSWPIGVFNMPVSLRTTTTMPSEVVSSVATITPTLMINPVAYSATASPTAMPTERTKATSPVTSALPRSTSSRTSMPATNSRYARPSEPSSSTVESRRIHPSPELPTAIPIRIMATASGTGRRSRSIRSGATTATLTRANRLT